MNDDMALRAVERYLALIDNCYAIYLEVTPRSRAYQDAHDEVVKGLPLIVQIGQRTMAEDFAQVTPFGGDGWPFAIVRLRVLELAGALRDRAEATEIFRPTGPQLSASALHPVIWEAAARLWDGGHHRQAVESAANAVDATLRAKVGRSDLRGRKLVAEAFSLKNPEPGKPRLRFLDIDDNDRDRWSNAHVGAMNFGTGCMMAIRNVVAHDPGEIDPQVALEQLAALSVLARWIDQAIVVHSA